VAVLFARSWVALASAAATVVLAGAAWAQPTTPKVTVPANPTGKKIEAPHYGDTLFEFFQDKYFSALTGLMTSQHFTRLAPHDDEAEVLRGGMLLSYGNHREAGELFERLIAQTVSPAVRNRAWYYLAKIRYQRDLPAEALAALAKIDAPLPAALQEDRQLLEGQLLLASGDNAGAVRVLEPLALAVRPGLFADEVPGNAFARFNLGVALLKSPGAAEQASGESILNAIGVEGADNEEQRNLRDRANLALGFAALQQERGQDARKYLERVRLNAQQSNKALLGFGWAAASLKQFDKAVVPWLELTQRDPGDAAVLEARLALPYAYAELGAAGQALSLYEKTVADYDNENLRLDQSVAAIRNGRWVQTMLERNPSDQMGWFANVRELPDAAAMPHAAHLSQVMAQHAFQESFKNLRDVLFLERNLNTWRDNLVVFRDILDHRKKTFAERLPAAQGGATAAAQTLAELRQRRAALAADLAQAEAAADGVAYANAQERDALARIASMKAILRDNPDAEIAERVKRVEGALVWQLAREFVPRRWAMQREAKLIDTTLAQAEERYAALQAAQQSEPQRFDAFATRIAALESRVNGELPRVVALAQEQQGVVQQIAVAALQEQKERLAAYTGQARFAIAQLVDRATSADAAPKTGAPSAPR
jgi:hypothetical protein